MKYDIQACNKLSERQRQEIAELIRLCEAREPVRMTPLLDPEENADPELPCFYLAYEGETGSLAGFLSTFLPDRETAEVSVWVRPDARRRGVMTALLRRAGENLADAHLSFYLTSDGNSDDASAVAEHWGLIPDHVEKMMEKRVHPVRGHLVSEQLILDDEAAGRRGEIYLRRRGQSRYLYRKDQKRYIGKCNLAPMSEEAVYLYGLEIREEWRNQGYGRRFLHLVEEQLPSCAVLRLQVSSGNPAACHLYEACGFQVSEQVIYYELSGKCRRGCILQKDKGEHI